ncbi:MAG: efflux RND transporter periplasmic adaptor subunit [Holophagaceae bacterium]|nr:efflux RND transporter periplasmic adaptor subunit [Holophagaceae bacterium]
MTRKKMALFGGGLLLILLVGIGIAKKGDQGVPVQAEAVGRENLVSKVSANGKVQAVKKVDISANMMGQVTRLAVKEGDPVKAGQFLLEIDPARSKASAEGLAASVEATAQDAESAKARLAQARSDFARAEANRKAGIISQADFEQLRTNLTTAERTASAAHQRVDQSKATLQDARIALSKTYITAPMDGVVTAKRIEVGETAVIGVQNSAGTVLLTISDMSKVEAEMEVDEASIPNVKQGQEAQVHIDAYPNQTFQGQVTEVGGSPILKISQNEATKFKVKVWIKNPPLTIKPGLSAQADIFTGSKDNVLAIPFQALVMRDPKKPGDAKGTGEKEATSKPTAGRPKEIEGVFIMEGGKSKFVPVKTGLLGDLNVEVVDGLKGGEQLITGPNRALRELKDGDTVKLDKSKKKDEKKS